MNLSRVIPSNLSKDKGTFERMNPSGHFPPFQRTTKPLKGLISYPFKG
jgi:hypothetical protein